ncbi:MAG: MFS transporter [Myxococcales bacterium]|nr:MFS transporter [Myxococcales bacterium]
MARQLVRDAPSLTRRAAPLATALGLLYAAQGVPFGIAAEYLPVVLRKAHYGYAHIAALFWLQLPWQLKVVWATAADHPRLRARTRSVILALQLTLAVAVATYAVAPFERAPVMWFVVTAVCALIASSQDVFVDAFAVRVLGEDERGFGNVAQVAGYRVGMLAGGAGLLLLVGSLGERTTLLAVAAFIALASVGAFHSGASAARAEATPHAEDAPPSTRTAKQRVLGLLSHLGAPAPRRVLAVAIAFKLGLHMAGSLIKPMTVDAGWSTRQIGAAVVTAGTVAGLVGAGAGGAVHRYLGEPRALRVAVVLQALACAPLAFVARAHAPLTATTAAIAAEHFASGLGTTVLFAALMSATRPRDAGLHYTILTSANALGIGLGGLAGGLVADRLGLVTAFALATAVAALPMFLLSDWRQTAERSRHEAV